MGCCPSRINLPFSGGNNLSERRARRWLKFDERTNRYVVDTNNDETVEENKVDRE